jgi:hypothetical protein
MWRHLSDAALNAAGGHGDFQKGLKEGQNSYQRVIKEL